MINNTVNLQIDNLVKNNEVVLFMKGTAEIPMCGFSAKVVAILNHLKVNFVDVNVLADPDLRQGIKDYTDWPTIPQLYIKGKFIGGSDIVSEMFTSGELVQFLTQEKIINV